MTHPRRFHLIFRPEFREGGNGFPPETVTACHASVTPQPFGNRSPARRGALRFSEVTMFDFDPRDCDSRDDERDATVEVAAVPWIAIVITAGANRTRGRATAMISMGSRRFTRNCEVRLVSSRWRLSKLGEQ